MCLHKFWFQFRSIDFTDEDLILDLVHVHHGLHQNLPKPIRTRPDPTQFSPGKKQG